MIPSEFLHEATWPYGSECLFFFLFALRIVFIYLIFFMCSERLVFLWELIYVFINFFLGRVFRRHDAIHTRGLHLCYLFSVSDKKYIIILRSKWWYNRFFFFPGVVLQWSSFLLRNMVFTPTKEYFFRFFWQKLVHSGTIITHSLIVALQILCYVVFCAVCFR